MNNLASLFLHN